MVAAVERVLIGKRPVVERVLTAMAARGHVLLVDAPGVGKTLLCKAIAAACGVRFGRIQFTPDLLPMDLTGASIYEAHERRFVFRPGPVFTHFLLADEINRATPKTQSALLEVMEERTVTVDGTTHPMAEPFQVLATMNPVEHEGTFALPAAQIDRFMMMLELGYPDAGRRGARPRRPPRARSGARVDRPGADRRGVPRVAAHGAAHPRRPEREARGGGLRERAAREAPIRAAR